MTFTEYINAAWVSLLLAAMCLYYAWILLKNNDIDKVRLKGSKALPKQKRKPYAEADGKILLGMGIGFLIVSILRYFNATVSVILSIALFITFIILWKKVYDTYE
jgi:uncharacterized membrane protein YfcA